MYGLPFQTLEELKNDIETALLYAPKHISYYQLTMEPDTPFGDNPPSLPEDEACWEMQKLIESYTEKNGFEHYEVSAYAKKNHRAKHNLNYWLFGDYLGIGAGAHSKISFPNKIIRQARISDPKNYIKKSGNGGKTFEGRVLEKDDLIFEFMLNALRLTKGFSLDLFEERTGLALNEMEEKLSNAIKKELIFQEGKIIKPTGLGKSFLSDLQEMFL